jgi:NAD(P)-dependent dehydrogenase (short-subunit alcohol dehydrogenase family)
MTEAASPSQGSLLVTGAASGIGKAIAEAALRDGYEVVLVDLDEGVLGAAATELTTHGTVHTFAADVTDEGSLVSGLANTRGQRAPLTGVAASAGIEVLGTVDQLDPAAWDRCLAVNLTGVFNTARAALPELLTSQGSFVAVASDAGITGAQGYAAYCASKHGVVGLVKAMALDYGPRGVRVNAVAPAFVETPMADRIFDGDDTARDYYRSVVPLGRFAQPPEVANAVLHLLGPGASYTNGHVYRVDGGATAGYFEPPAT